MQEEKDFIKELLDPKTQNVAFQKLLHDYQKPLYNHIRNIVLNHDDTDDVLQNTFVKVFQHLKNFKIHRNSNRKDLLLIYCNEECCLVGVRQKFHYFEL